MELVQSLIDHMDLNPRPDGSGLHPTPYGAQARISAVCSQMADNKKRPEGDASGRIEELVAGARNPRQFALKCSV